MSRGRCDREDVRLNCGCCVLRPRCCCERVRVRPPRRRCCGATFEGLALQLTTVEDLEIPACSPVVFDEVLTDDSWFITYDEKCGELEIHKRGLYAIDWNIVCDGTSSDHCIRFGIEVNDEIQSSVAIPSGSVQQLCGNTLIKVGHHPVKIRLVNTGAAVKLPAVSPVANLCILACE